MSNKYALLAEKPKKGAANPARAKEPEGPVLTPEQKAILAARKESQTKAKEEKALKKAEAEKCYFNAKCGNKKNGKWPYCDDCYSGKKVECGKCHAFVYLSGQVLGEYSACKNCGLLADA